MEDVAQLWREMAFCGACALLILAAIGALFAAFTAHRDLLRRELPPNQNQPVQFHPLRRKQAGPYKPNPKSTTFTGGND